MVIFNSYVSDNQRVIGGTKASLAFQVAMSSLSPLAPREQRLVRSWAKAFSWGNSWENRGFHVDLMGIPSGNLLHNYGKTQCLMGKSTISMGYFLQLYVSLPEGIGI